MNVVRRIGQIISECNQAQLRLTYRRLAFDSYLPGPNVAPDTYAEFLLRTSGPSPTEPSAHQRRAGRTTR